MVEKESKNNKKFLEDAAQLFAELFLKQLEEKIIPKKKNKNAKNSVSKHLL